MKIAQKIHQFKLLNNFETELFEDLVEIQNVSLIEHYFPQKLSETQKSEYITNLETEGKDLKKKIELAQEQAGDTEILEAKLEFARFCFLKKSETEALEAYKSLTDAPKKLSSGKLIDIQMEMARVCSFYDLLGQTNELVEKCKSQADDWDRRNRLKVYDALVKLLQRDVKGAAELLVDCIATFSCVELCSYEEFLTYTILSNVLYLPRTELKKKVIDGPEILAIKSEIPVVYKLVNCFYDCDYSGFLQSIVDIQPLMVADRFLQPHSNYILRELHVLGYKQFLDSYKSVTLDSMAMTFGVSAKYLDTQLSRFIAAGRLSAKIDKVGGIVETTRPDVKNGQYRDMIQQGDMLLNRIQKLARVVDI